MFQLVTVSGMEDDESQRMARIYLSVENLMVETKRMMWFMWLQRNQSK